MSLIHTLLDLLPDELQFEIDKFIYGNENVILIDNSICLYYEDPQKDGFFIYFDHIFLESSNQLIITEDLDNYYILEKNGYTIAFNPKELIIFNGSIWSKRISNSTAAQLLNL